MTTDDIIYALLLGISFFAGHFVSRLSNTRGRQLICFAFGFGMVLIVCRHDVVHSFTMILINSGIVLLMPKRWCHVASFMWCFSYLAFFRTLHWFGLPKVRPHSNAVQLLLTLKMVGLAFEVHDAAALKRKLSDSNDKGAALSDTDDAETKEKKQKERRNEELQLELYPTSPSLLDVFFYGYCYVGLLTGPYFKYSVYHDFVQCRPLSKAPTLEGAWARLLQGLLYFAVYILVSHFYYIEFAESEEFFSSSLASRLWFLVMMYVVFRLRVYAAWSGAESVCLAAGFGAYPVAMKPRCGQGPTDLAAYYDSDDKAALSRDVDYRTIKNIDEWSADFSPTLRQGMRAWNMTVQWWLASFVYRRVPVKPLRTSVTLLVSAYWHGIHPGYYLSFMTIPLVLAAEDALAANLRSRLSEAGQRYYDYVNWFFKMRALDYTALGFLLLKGVPTLNVWSSIYFYIQVGAVVGLAVAYAIGRPRRGAAETRH